MALHIFGCSRMQEELQREERNPSWLSHFLPSFPKDLLPETRISDRTLVVRYRMVRLHVLILCCLLTCLFPPFIAVSGVPKGAEPCFPSQNEISSVKCAAGDPVFNKGAVLKPGIAPFASSRVVTHFPFPKL